MSFYSHTKLIKHLYNKKRNDKAFTIMGLDFGRKYVGSAISCASLKKTYATKVYNINPQYNYVVYDFAIHSQFYKKFAADVKAKKVKALVVGYPLREGTQITPMATYVQSFCNFILSNKVFEGPVTLINDYQTSEQKALKVLLQNQKSPDKFFLESIEDSLKTKGELFGDYLQTELVNKKTIYDTHAAQEILEKFLDMYNQQVTQYEDRREKADKPTRSALVETSEQ
ncbi:unnamed protein product [Moneuplotes crassus]|uniref:YqgF/RNase H-like domain-containing protein n=1 Tax=Euplotes crassus TaxID=5936 RepID=A0AAD2D4E4_EUPCR|nr:unnamed protein product [Moneuplotes crassus]